MAGVVLAVKYFLGENLSVLVRLIILVVAGAGTYLLSIRLIRPVLYVKILELARMAVPKSLIKQN
jgi:hypothetical protein